MKETQMTVRSKKRSAAIVFAHCAVLLLSSGCAPTADIPNESKAPAPLARMGGVAAVVKGKLYFIGGITKASSTTDVVHEYDPVRNEWSSKSSMPTPRASAAAVGLNESVYVLGGRRDDAVLSTVEKYDPASNSWSKCAPMPTPRWQLMTAVVDGRIYALGGIAGIGNARRVLDVVEVYDALNDKWSVLPPMPVGESSAGTAVIGTRIFMTGGRLEAGADASGSASSKVYVYDTATGKWEMGPSMNQNRTGLAACALEGRIYAIGGASRGNNTATIEVLELNANKWTLMQTLRKPRAGHNCAVLGGKIYVVGGNSAPSLDAILATLEEISPQATK